MNRTIYLVGFMGSGKSTVGPLLSRRLDCSFYDLDSMIEQQQGNTIAEIFSSQGEHFFRKLESECLLGSRQLGACVMALGGGTFVDEDNRKFIAQNGISVWLDIPLAMARKRCLGKQRPLARDAQQFEALYRQRQPSYRLADIRIRVENKKPRQICLETLDRLRDNPD